MRNPEHTQLIIQRITSDTTLDAIDMIQQLCSELQSTPMDVIVDGHIPPAILPEVLPWAYSTGAGFISPYAGTDTLVRIFQSVGFVSDSPYAGAPTGPTVIYRGTTLADKKQARGLSWTTSVDIARYFAHRLDEALDNLHPTVWTAVINPDGVIGMFYNQQESEIVINPRKLRQLRVLEQGM